MVILDPISLVELGNPQPFLIITISRGLVATTTIVKHISSRNRELDISLRDPGILDASGKKKFCVRSVQSAGSVRH